MDELFFKKAQAGDVEAFETLITSYERLIYSITYNYFNNPQDAKDISQEIFIKVFLNIKSCRDAASFKGWLCKIAANACVDELRKRKNRPYVSLDDDVEAFGDSIPSPADGPEAAAIRGETASDVRAAINKLPDDYRTIIILRDIHDLSYTEIAEATSSGLGTVKSRLSRARDALRSILAPPKKSEKNFEKKIKKTEQNKNSAVSVTEEVNK